MDLSDKSPLKIDNQIVYYRSSENMIELVDESIDLIVTSPPYGTIKDYDHLGQIGFFDDFDQYIKRLALVWKECYRVLKPSRRLAINIGDQYLRAKTHGRYRILPIGAAITLSCIKLGFDFLGDIIWKKVSTTQTTGGGALMGSVFYPRNGLVTYDYEHILIFKKPGKSKANADSLTKEKSKICLDEWKKWYVGHWTIPGVRQLEHIAMFPEEIPYRIIRMFSLVNDTILDPFVGSGTSLKVAMALQRNGIGYEINPNYRDIQESKITEGRKLEFFDFQSLAIKLIETSNRNNISIQYGKQRRRGFFIFEAKTNQVNYLVDMIICDKISTLSELKEIIAHKLNEIHISHILSSSLDKLADKVILVLNGLHEDFSIDECDLYEFDVFMFDIKKLIHIISTGNLLKSLDTTNTNKIQSGKRNMKTKHDLSAFLDSN